jgi:hypothetical protein
VTQLGAHGKRREGENTDKDGFDVVLLADLAGLPSGALLLTLGRLPLRLLLPLPRLLLLLPHPLPAEVGPIKDMGSDAQFAQQEGKRRGRHTSWVLVAGKGPTKAWATGRRAAAARGEREKKNGKQVRAQESSCSGPVYG